MQPTDDDTSAKKNIFKKNKAFTLALPILYTELEYHGAAHWYWQRYRLAQAYVTSPSPTFKRT